MRSHVYRTEAIVLRRSVPELGEINVHFPRVGFDVTAA